MKVQSKDVMKLFTARKYWLKLIGSRSKEIVINSPKQTKI